MITQGTTSVKFGAEHSQRVQSSQRGRKSIRLESKATYTKGLFIADIKHMPGGACGAWPAFWTFGPNWPSSGEIGMFLEWSGPIGLFCST
jgi:beta-glucanase (GH16 family)